MLSDNLTAMFLRRELDTVRYTRFLMTLYLSDPRDFFGFGTVCALRIYPEEEKGQ